MTQTGASSHDGAVPLSDGVPTGQGAGRWPEPASDLEQNSYLTQERSTEPSGVTMGDVAGTIIGTGTGSAVPASEQQNQAPKRGYQLELTPEQEQELCERYTGPSPMMQALVKSAKKSKPYHDYLRSRHLTQKPGGKLGTVFIAVEPIVRKDWLGKYMSWMEETVFDHLRSARLYIIVLWGDGTATRYHSFVRNGQVAAASARLGQPPALDVTTTLSTNTPPDTPSAAPPADFPDTPHAFCTTFAAENPTTSIVSVGQSSLSRKEVESFLIAWANEGKRGSEKNRRAFVDRFLNFVVTHNRVWEFKAVQPTGADQTAPYYFDPIRGFKSPLAWYLWRYKRTKDCRKELARRNAVRHGGLKLSVDRRTRPKTQEPTKHLVSAQTNFTSQDNLVPVGGGGGPSSTITPRDSGDSSESEVEPVRVSFEFEDSPGAGAESSEDGSPRGSEDGRGREYLASDRDDARISSYVEKPPPLPPLQLPPVATALPLTSSTRRSSDEKASKLRKKKKGKQGMLSISSDYTGDGRVTVDIPSPSHISPASPRHPTKTTPTLDPSAITPRPPVIIMPNGIVVPRSNILITTVGSRGDVQPFLAVGIQLRDMGHRVRVATHECFRKFVIEEGDLEFYPLGGDPHELMAYMVKNPGLIPTMDSVKSGDIGRKRDVIAAIVESCWRACTEADPGPPPGTNEDGTQPHPKLPPFVAECIIGNPPSFGHIHVAERLSIPLHMMFTMPWSPTRAFPHPLLNVEKLLEYGKREGSALNLYSYTFCEMLTWQGLGDVINKWRREQLDLPGVPVKVGSALMTNLKVPHTYMWSPNLIPKPDDWPEYLDVTGFCFLSSLSTNYEPDDKLGEFLKAGETPVYIGFGSIVVDDPRDLTRIVFEAVRRTGLRAIVSKGWGEFGGKEEDAPENICLIGNVPHDWLFKQVTAVCHHGGAGTTAAGLKLGRPTIVVPFFGDQPFWGSMIAQAGAGPQPIPHKKLTVENLCDALLFATSDRALAAAGKLGERMREENGSLAACFSFHRHLPLHQMRCDVDPTRHAAFYNPQSDMKLSVVAAQVLISEGRIRRSRLYRYIPKRWVLERAQGDVFTAALDGLRSLFVNLLRGFTSLFNETAKSVRNASKKHFGSAILEVCKGIAKGFGKFIYYPFKGLGTFIGYMIEGLKNSNTVFDTTEIPSESPMVFGFSDGCFKGMESLFANVFGALFDVVWKPIAGVYRSGFSGFWKGCLRGVVSFLTKIPAGALELVYLPLKGLVISVDKVRSGHRLVSIEREALPKISIDEWNEILLNYDAFLQHRVTHLRGAEGGFRKKSLKCVG